MQFNITRLLLFFCICLFAGTASAQIGDRVWLDQNGNGVQDTGEPPIPNVVVRLFRADFNDNPIQLFGETVTAANGRYRFDVSPFYRYVLHFEIPSGYAATVPFVGTAGRDSDALPDGFTRGFYSFGGELTKDAGLVSAGGTVGDRVWRDTNQNGQQDPGEPNEADVKVTLWQDVDLDGTVDYPFALTYTTANGRYLFTSVPTGDFRVQFEGPKFMTYTTPEASSIGIDSNVIPGAGFSAMFSVTDNETIKHIDAGLIPGGARLGDLVWEDLNENGVQDPGEPGMQNHTVHLWEDTDGDDQADFYLQQTTTNIKGKYRFNQLPTDKSYVVQVEPKYLYGFTIPEATSSDQDSNVGTVSGRSKSAVTLQPGVLRDDVDAGMTNTGTIWIDGTVWDDSYKSSSQGTEYCGDGLNYVDDPGIADVPVYLYADDFLDGNFALIDTRVTSGTGQYLFRTSKTGIYQVRTDAPQGTGFTFPFVPERDSQTEQFPSGIDPDTGDSEIISGASTKVNIGLTTDPASVGDRVWWDTNGNGVQDSGESSFNPATDGTIEFALVRDQDGDQIPETPVLVASPKANGRYRFESVSPGHYKILVNVQSPGAIFSPVDAASDGIDSDFTETNTASGVIAGESETFYVGPGESVMKYDLGLKLGI